jgi:hypothetical protein
MASAMPQGITRLALEHVIVSLQISRWDFANEI